MAWFSKFAVLTNATKAQIGFAINAILLVLVAFNVVLTQTQLASISIAVNAVLSLFVAGTYAQSNMRVDDPPSGTTLKKGV